MTIEMDDDSVEVAESPVSAKPRKSSKLSLRSSPRVLIVEDDPAMSELIATLLSTQWIDCVIRRSGLQGSKAFRHYPVDLIITDLRMSEGDGIEMIERIRRFSPAPVIIVTGYSREYADRVRFLNHVAMIGKPFENEVLLELVERALEYGIDGTCEDATNHPDDEFQY
jgi:DNA-binding response OmpR family regulator